MSASVVPPDEFFSALDGKSLSIDGCAWSVCVFSVTDSNDKRWVQLALEGRDRKVLTLRLATSHDLGEAVESLTCFLADPLGTADVLSHVA